MRAQEFFQKAEELAGSLQDENYKSRAYNVIRTAENKILGSFPAPVQDWPEQWHEAAIQTAKQHFDFYGVEYVEGE
jgi:hypothetical protein